MATDDGSADPYFKPTAASGLRLLTDRDAVAIDAIPAACALAHAILTRGRSGSVESSNSIALVR
ncbi:hypothetical protein GCM10010254_75100 [Streptomyces chromofuscus]|nr:hypothetical protein GCM10010254_75100 [Streptomyces chromofuscus]